MGAKDKYGVVDSEDNPIIEINYSNAFYTMFGENYVMGDRTNWLLVKPNGEEIKNSEFQNVSTKWYDNAEYFDVQQIATDWVSQIETKGYTPIIGKQNIKDIANALNLNAENQKRAKKYIEIPSFKADVYDVQVSLSFNERTIYEKTHKEIVNDGWFSREKTVSDGWDWNEKAMLEYIYLKIDNLDKSIKYGRLDCHWQKSIFGKLMTIKVI